MLRRPPRSTRTDTTLSLHDALPISAYASYLSSDFVDEDFAFFGTTLNGIKENKPRWKRGVDFEESALGEMIGKMYVARYFQPEAKARMEKLVQNLLGAYKQSIQSLDWMTEETTKAEERRGGKEWVRVGDCRVGR